MRVPGLLGPVAAAAIAAANASAFGQSVTVEDPSAPAPAAPASEAPSVPVLPPPVPNPAGGALAPDVHQISAVYLVLGLGTPIGGLGLEWVSRIGSSFEISFGFGAGLDAAYSEPNPPLGHYLQWSVMPRFVLGNEHGGFTLGAGLSGGNDGNANFFCFDDNCSGTYPVSHFVSANIEVGGEAWTSIGLAIRGFLGYEHGWCISSPCVWATTNYPYLGFGIGYAF